MCVCVCMYRVDLGLTRGCARDVLVWGGVSRGYTNHHRSQPTQRTEYRGRGEQSPIPRGAWSTATLPNCLALRHVSGWYVWPVRCLPYLLYFYNTFAR